ncbi:succinylglutamate desuccinylase/aspartoacylase family protein [Bacteriovorax sp. DB6_IX]|nr:succinylglutamate desuccinylase/aspartoacylase family protein [Bacteriovorax sp. DB6_IX]EQC52452.1 succinylglutamate desuccinylase/aspartoacylase family protein [Bacteriovorax sp. DB6_IX]
MKTKKDPDVLVIGGTRIKRGERKKLQLEVSTLFDYTELKIPVEVIRGKEKGPVLFISGAIHGDEINGVEIVRRILKRKILSKIKGTLILVPVVNIFGFNNKSRYLPDRKDLNRSFPGTKKGSLASQMAYIFMKEIVSKCTHGIDLHTAAVHRTNYPQIRASLDDNIETEELAKEFGAPVIINSKLRDGSLREAARKRNVRILLFEGGQALRFEENVIQVGLKGCLRVMKKIGMITSRDKYQRKPAFIANSSYWVRAPHGGTFSAKVKIGNYVEEGDTLAVIADLFGSSRVEVVAEKSGIVVGANLLPLVTRGDAMFHIANFDESKKVIKAVEDYFED